MMEMEVKADAMQASFDMVARQDAQEAAMTALGGRVDALSGDVDGVKARLDKIASAAQRPALTGVKSMDPVARSFIDGYLRTGQVSGIKSLDITAPGDGGYAVPKEIDALIGRTLVDISPIRRIATVVQTGSANYRKLMVTGATASGWVAETVAGLPTATPTFNEIAPPTGELFANPGATQAMLDDAGFDVETWLADEIAREFARAEGAAFINGTGVSQPIGFLTAPTAAAADAVRPFGTLEYLATGVAGDFAASQPEDALIDLIHRLRPAYRQGASFVMNSATLSRIRKMRSGEGDYLWQPSLMQGQPDTLLGYPVVEAQDMPDIAAGNAAIAFGNFREGYLIAERTTTTILRDPFTNKPFVQFYATRRIGGQVMNSEAIKLLKFAAN